MRQHVMQAAFTAMMDQQSKRKSQQTYEVGVVVWDLESPAILLGTGM
jgi:hypothetical protein